MMNTKEVLGEAETLPGALSELLSEYAIPISAATKVVNGAKTWKQIKNLQNFIPNDPKPSLLHGDLWEGNILFQSNKFAGFIDPGSFFGHNEMEIAYLRWFNPSFIDSNFLEKYSAYIKLEKNYLVIRYEELVHNPEVEMKRVEDFVGWPLNPSYLKFYEAANYRRMASSPILMGGREYTIPVREDSALEGAIGSDHDTHRPIKPDSIGRWKKPVHNQRMKDILTLYKDELTDMLIKLKYETNKDWTNEIK